MIPELRVREYGDIKRMNLDDLRREKNLLDADFNDVGLEIIQLTESKKRITDRIQVLKSEISRRTTKAPEPKVSEHALLRYIERVHGIDMKELENIILTEKVKNAMFLGATSVTCDGYRYVLKDNVVITVTEG